MSDRLPTRAAHQTGDFGTATVTKVKLVDLAELVAVVATPEFERAADEAGVSVQALAEKTHERSTPAR
jgi:hypothetical protein